MTTICIDQMIAELRAELKETLLTRRERREAKCELATLIADKRLAAEQDVPDDEGFEAAVALLPCRGDMSRRAERIVGSLARAAPDKSVPRVAPRWP